MLETKVLPIEYDEIERQEAEKIKVIIERNPMLFQVFLAGHNKISFLDGDEEDVLYISSLENFKELLSYVIPQYMEMLKEQVSSTGGDDLETIFLKILLVDKISSRQKNEIHYVATPTTIKDINAIYSIVGMSYYNFRQEHEKIIDFIFEPTEEEKEKILDFLKRRQRYNLMNLLLEDEYQSMLELEAIEHDSYLRTHLETLLELSEVDMSERFKYTEEKQAALPKLPQQELDKLCIEFLIQIDPSLKWLKLYNKLKRNHNILYGEEFPDPCSKWGCIETTNDIYIYAPLAGDISDFMYFIHEFAHCITLFNKEKGECIPSSVQEFPSIFFERLATAFLREKGYSDQDVTDLEEERIKATLSNRSDISPSLRYLTQYINSGPITYETEKEKMDRIRSAIPEELPDEMKDLLNDLMSTQDEDNVHIKIDAEIAFLLEHPNCIFEEYPYVLGSALADKAIDKIGEEPMIIYTMLEITENLTKETAQSVMQKIGLIDEEYATEKPSTQYVKKQSDKKN